MSWQGIGTVVGLGEESTWATEVARSVWAAVSSVSVKAAARHEASDTLVHNSSNANLSHMFLAGVDVGGSIEIPACYEGGSCIGLLLKHAMGSVSTGSPSSSIYPHTFSLASALPTGLTLEVLRGNSGVAEEVYGAKVGKLEFSIAAGQQAKIMVDLIAKNQQARASGGSPTLGTRYPILHKHGGTFAFNSVNYTSVNSFKLVIDNKLTREQCLGSEYTQEPVRSQHSEITIEVELNWSSNAPYVAAIAGTEATASLTLTDGTNSLAISGTARAIECDDPISGPGTIKQRVKFRVLGALSVVLNNSKSSAVAD